MSHLETCFYLLRQGKRKERETWWLWLLHLLSGSCHFSSPFVGQVIELCLRMWGGTIILCTGKGEDWLFITSYHVVHDISFVHSHFDTLTKVVSARLLHYKHLPPCSLCVYSKKLLWSHVNIPFFTKLFIYSFISLFISGWTHGFPLIHWVIICCCHYLSWLSNCPRFGQWESL